MKEPKQNKKGFTLVELLIVMAILGALVALVAGNFITSQMKARDAQRKSDLKQVSQALELFYSDYERYPASDNGLIVACPYNRATPANSVSCSWGSDSFTDGNSIYFKKLPNDPARDADYYYRTNATGTGYQLFTRLENSQDPSNKTEISDLGYSCGTGNCNMGITSSNVEPTTINW